MAIPMTYDFACIHCDHEVEIKMTLRTYLAAGYDDRCPKHGCSGTLRRVIKSAPTTQFKGDWPDKKGVEE